MQPPKHEAGLQLFTQTRPRRWLELGPVPQLSHPCDSGLKVLLGPPRPLPAGSDRGRSILQGRAPEDSCPRPALRHLKPPIPEAKEHKLMDFATTRFPGYNPS